MDNLWGENARTKRSSNLQNRVEVLEKIIGVLSSEKRKLDALGEEIFKLQKNTQFVNAANEVLQLKDAVHQIMTHLGLRISMQAKVQRIEDDWYDISD